METSLLIVQRQGGIPSLVRGRRGLEPQPRLSRALDVPDDYNAQWSFVPRGTRGFEIVNRLSGQCLDIWHENPSPLLQWPCHGGLGQRWEFDTAASDGSYRVIKNVYSGLVVNQSGATNAWAADVIQWWQSPGATNERIVITPAESAKASL